MIDPERENEIQDFLNQAYAAGYDARAKDYNQIQEKKVIQEDKNHRFIRDFPSMAQARRAHGMSKSGMINAIRYNLLTRKGYYFRYAKTGDNKDTDGGLCNVQEETTGTNNKESTEVERHGKE
ncbi:MAG: hypothetical protein LLG05_05215 [Porphyromonadaceae bacterium]|nr:hypothetical protein [Porphyromonadaceae bacterium]